jgi:hypothetical protein
MYRMMVIATGLVFVLGVWGCGDTAGPDEYGTVQVALDEASCSYGGELPEAIQTVEIYFDLVVGTPTRMARYNRGQLNAACAGELLQAFNIAAGTYNTHAEAYNASHGLVNVVSPQSADIAAHFTTKVTYTITPRTDFPAPQVQVDLTVGSGEWAKLVAWPTGDPRP